MVIFGIELENEDLKFNEFVNETNLRLDNNNVVSNPFVGKILQLKGNLFIVKMQPLYPNFTYFIWMVVVAVYFYKGLHWIHIPGMLLGSLCFFWSKYFFNLMLQMGAKKHGCKAKISMINNKKIMEEVFFT